MSRLSNLFAAGIFIVFLAVLFHYFCRVRKKPDMIVQQQTVQVPEGYVYPITPNTNNALANPHHLVIAQNYGHLHPQFMTTTSNLPYPVNAGPPYPYNFANNSSVPAHGPGGYTRSQLHSNPARPNQPEDDLPPPYHVAVSGGASYPQP